MDAGTFCGNLQGLLTLLGYVITAFKIIIPLLLIFLWYYLIANTA